MSPREKNLLIFFAAAGFLVINFLLFGFFKTQRNKVNQQRNLAIQKLETAELFRENSAQVEDEMNWLAEHEPEPAEDQDVQTKLQQLCEGEAKNAGLSIKSQKPLPTEATEGLHFHRAKFQFTVNGAEDALYKWFYALNTPDQFRTATNIKLSPNKEDDTKIDCVATIEQWFVPLVASDSAPEPESE
jgi:hypothetical protein